MNTRKTTEFDPNCRRCPRLAAFLDEVQEEFPDYFCAPVPAFGDPNAKLLIIGLAPGKHGANRTGRPFTGDYAGVLLYETLHKLGLASASESMTVDDGLQLMGCRISNAVKCLPPDNKPIGSEINECNQFISTEIENMPEGSILLALGKIAHDATMKALGMKLSACKFGHAAEHQLPNGLTLVDSYHCSRYNTQTKRLTAEMFENVMRRARDLSR